MQLHSTAPLQTSFHVHPQHTCATSAPVASHKAEMELTEEMRYARKALAVSLESSADQRLVQMMRSRGTQWA